MVEQEGKTSGRADVPAGIGEAREEEEEGEGPSSCMAGSRPEEEEGDGTGRAEDEEENVYVVVGTGEEQKSSRWSPCKGRLLLIQLARSGPTKNGMHFLNAPFRPSGLSVL